MILIIFIFILGMIREQNKNDCHMKRFDRPTCLILFNMDNTIATVANMNETTALQLSTLVGNGLIHGCQVLIKKDFSSSMEVVFFTAQLQKLFVLAKTFSQLFLLINFTIVFCVLEVGLPIRWHASIYFGST